MTAVLGVALHSAHLPHTRIAAPTAKELVSVSMTRGVSRSFFQPQSASRRRYGPVRSRSGRAGRGFRRTGRGGTDEILRDGPIRVLLVELGPEAGAMQPVMKHGRPEYVWLGREECEGP